MESRWHIRCVQVNSVYFDVLEKRIAHKLVTCSKVPSVKHVFSSLFEAKQKHNRAGTTLFTQLKLEDSLN